MVKSTVDEQLEVMEQLFLQLTKIQVAWREAIIKVNEAKANDPNGDV